MTIRAHGAAKIVAGCLFAVAAILGTTALTVANSNASSNYSCATGTPSSSPSPAPTSTPSPSASPGQVTLCEQVTYTGSGVSPGGSTPFTIKVWTTGGPAYGVVVTLSGTPSGVTPRFTNCPLPPNGTKNTATSCTVSPLNGAQTFLAALGVPSSAGNGETVTLNPQATAANPKLKVNTWAPATVSKSGSTGTGTGSRQTNTGGGRPSGTGSGNGTTGTTGTTGTAGTAGTAGNGSLSGAAGSPSAAAVAAGTGNPLAFTAGPLRKFLPLINGGSPTHGNGNISAQLPSIPPAALPTAKSAGYHARDSGPLSRQMLGTQLLGLAALCAAAGIVLIRFWRRKPDLATGTGATRTPAPAPGGGPGG